MAVIMQSIMSYSHYWIGFSFSGAPYSKQAKQLNVSRHYSILGSYMPSASCVLVHDSPICSLLFASIVHQQLTYFLTLIYDFQIFNSEL